MSQKGSKKTRIIYRTQKGLCRVELGEAKFAVVILGIILRDFLGAILRGPAKAK
jgi:hypothetical protein